MRLLALDQATKITGYAIFIDGKLETFGKIVADQESMGDRLFYIREHIAKLIADYGIDYLAFEDIQLQKEVNGVEMVNNVDTFKKLAEVFGVVYEYATSLGLPNESVLASSWKSTLQIKGARRDDQKRAAQAFAQARYQIKCTQDEADAICIGTHILVKHNLTEKPKQATKVVEEGFDWS